MSEDDQTENYRQVFPKLTKDNHRKTSDPDIRYNCIGYAAGSELWWEPVVEEHFWPDGVPNEYTIEAYVGAFESRGYVVCEDGDFEDGIEKVALFANKGFPSHAARQLDAQNWTSKLGEDLDISHELSAIEGDFYGNVVLFLCRPSPTS